MTENTSGLGDTQAHFKVYIGNRPDYADYHSLSEVRALRTGDIHALGQHCGNGWRKVFNVYAKLLYALGDSVWCRIQPYGSWQAYRDQALLQANSQTALLFSTPQLNDPLVCHVVMGKHYGMSLDLPVAWHWLDANFAVLPGYHAVLCPYFDYRQLTNERIGSLSTLLKSWQQNQAG